MDATTLIEQPPKVVHKYSISDYSSEVLTLSNVKTIVHRAWDHDVQVIDYTVESYSNEKLGYLSLHRSLKVIIKRKNALAPEQQDFFIKWLPLDNDTLGRDMLEDGVFDREAAFYSEIVPLLQCDFLAEPWAPKCYLITKDAIILEDLRSKGFSMRDKLLNKEETLSALSAIARMHASSILAEKRLGKRLNEICPRAFDLSSYHKRDGLWQKYFQAGMDLAVAVAEQLKLETGKIRITCEKLLELIEPSQEKQNVVTQSDLWSNNIMFDENSPPKCVIVDYQLMRYCPLAQDLMVFLHLCTNRDFRRKHQEEMIRYYYNKLCEILRLHQPKIQVPKWSEILQGIKEQTLSAVIITMLYFPTVLMDGKISAMVLANSEDYMRFRYYDKRITVLPLMQQGGQYEERIKESVMELVEMAEKLDQIPKPR